MVSDLNEYADNKLSCNADLIVFFLFFNLFVFIWFLFKFIWNKAVWLYP